MPEPISTQMMQCTTDNPPNAQTTTMGEKLPDMARQSTAAPCTGTQNRLGFLPVTNSSCTHSAAVVPAEFLPRSQQNQKLNTRLEFFHAKKRKAGVASNVRAFCPLLSSLFRLRQFDELSGCALCCFFEAQV
jgi:hypothetical protein